MGSLALRNDKVPPSFRMPFSAAAMGQSSTVRIKNDRHGLPSRPATACTMCWRAFIVK